MSVDEKTAQRILELLPQFQAWHIEEYITLSSFTALTYYYLTSFDEEVAYIWSQKRTFGKIFYLTTRYSAISTMAFAFLTNWRTYMRIPVSGCQTIIYFQNLSRTSAEATLWLCLYALIGGKARYLCFLVVIFLAFSIPISVLGLHHVLTQKAIDRSILDHTLGYACNFAPGKYPTHQVISEYINLTRTALALLAGVVTIVKRYRGHNSTLLKVIKREGGFYYMSALVLRFLVSLSGNTGSPVLSVVSPGHIYMPERRNNPFGFFPL
ncbi:hypothetical protein FA13DRAFT_243143 [Coprinellus micaceus]|uniref:DUF6533 domain-containing protein n=1 Tax=Coprinellus micaceus TaxID=71717 RepID=A0A4Y7SEV6_COPMI|nr:hypothetical protein FA13DRAFT_243143 [Coprinellus micaceus]